MSDLALHLPARSGAAVADVELLRVARTDLEEPEAVVALTRGERLRGLASFRATRPADDRRGGGAGTGPVED